MIYFDNAATSWPKPPQVLDAMVEHFNVIGGSPGRAGHRLSTKAARGVFEARELLAQLFNIADPQQIAFTKNITEALNYSFNLLNPGDHVITSSMEHNSVMRPLRYLESKGVQVSVIPCDSLGYLNPSDIITLLKPNTRMLVINHASNVIGTIQPLSSIGKLAKDYGLFFVVDAAQTAGCYPIDVAKMNIDILCFTGHKSLLGPQGTGGIYINPLLDIPPLLLGGTGSNSEFETQPKYMPDMLESGTLNTPGILGLGAGVKYILDTGLDNIRNHEVQLTQFFIDNIVKCPGINVYGPLKAEEKAPVVSVNIEGVVCSEVGTILDKFFNIMTRTGLHCAPTAHKTINTFPQGTVRFSFSYFNTQKEVQSAIEALKEIVNKSKA